MPKNYGSKSKSGTPRRGKSKAPTTINKQAQKQLEAIGYTGSAPKAKSKPKSRVTIWPK